MSNRKPMFAAEVKPDLTLRFINPAQFKQHLVPLAGDVVMVTAEKIRNHRTNKQNHYYWGVVLKTIAIYCGYSKQEDLETLHHLMRQKFLPKRGNLSLPVSTTSLTTEEMNEYIESIRLWALKRLGVYVPEPNEVEGKEALCHRTTW